MKQSFKKTDNSEPVDIEALAVVESDDQLPVVQDEAAVTVGAVQGEVKESDLILPRLNVVQGVGPLSENFDSGDIVLNRETLLVGKETPLNVVVLSIKKYYEEYIPYSSDGPRPKTYASLQEVLDDGKWIEWRNNERPPANAVATAMLLIEKPADLESASFSNNLGGKDYAIALWSLRGSAYTSAAKKIFSANSLELKQSGILSGLWELSTTKQVRGGNPVAVPILRLVGRVDGDLQKEIVSALSPEA